MFVDNVIVTAKKKPHIAVVELKMCKKCWQLLYGVYRENETLEREQQIVKRRNGGTSLLNQ